MPQVDLANILPEEDALQKITEIFNQVENNKETYVITKNGRPVFAIIDIDQLENKPNSTPAQPITPPAPALETPVEAPINTPPPTPGAASLSPLEDSLPSMEEPTLTPATPLQPPPVAPMPSQPTSPIPPSTVPPLTGDLNLNPQPQAPQNPGDNSPLA